jgi:hypothetical protein
MRRSGGVSKILLIKKLKSKVYVSFLISLYYTPEVHGSSVWQISKKYLWSMVKNLSSVSCAA